LKSLPRNNNSPCVAMFRDVWRRNKKSNRSRQTQRQTTCSGQQRPIRFFLEADLCIQT